VAALRAIGQFDLQGRLAAATDTEGFSAGLRWQQQDDHATIDLSAPLGFGAAHIEQTAMHDLQLTTSKGQVLDSAAAGDELRATLGFEPPLASLQLLDPWRQRSQDQRAGVARYRTTAGAPGAGWLAG
jgi:outer membrane biogenesis lipoprotein LolB